jgi:hypothetical protein
MGSIWCLFLSYDGYKEFQILFSSEYPVMFAIINVLMLTFTEFLPALAFGIM